MALDVATPLSAGGGPGGPRTPAPRPRPGPGRPQTVRLMVRLHFLSGFLAAPVIVSLAVTGILFAWNPQIETALHRDALTASAPGDPARPLTEQVEAARAAHPGWTVTGITPAAPAAFEGRETTAVAMAPPAAAEGGEFGHAAGAVSVYVDPSTATVTGEIDEAKRPGEWLRNLHSSIRLGDHVAPVTELAASWLLISILTGLYLRWPALRRSLRRELSFRHLRRPGLPRARSLHVTLGVWLTAGLLLLVGTGLTWTSFAGSRVDDLKATFSSPVPAVSTTLPGFAAPGGVPGGVPGGEHAEHGESAGLGGPADSPASPPLDAAAVLPQLDTVAGGVAAADVSGLLTYTPPSAEGTAWKVEVHDTKWPLEPANLAVDGESGEVLDRVDWGERPALAKATSVGIYFHQATLFGIWTQLYLTAVSVALIVLIVAGYRMWWLRRPAGSFGAPARVGPLWRTVPVPVMVVFALLAYAMPTLAVSFLVYLALERIWRALRRPAPAAPGSLGPPQERIPADA